MRVFFFNWPSAVGGADTKLAHVLRLLGATLEVTVVPNSRAQLAQAEWAAWVAACGCRAALLEDLPDRLDGWAVSLCNAEFLRHGTLLEARRRGLRIAWSSEMMWHFQGECAALTLGLIDAVLYVSPEQRRRLEPGYRHALGARGSALHDIADEAATSGWIPAPPGRPPVRWVTLGNYIDPDVFPMRPRSPDGPARPFTIGRLSRPDPDKFPDEFPATYEALGLREPVRFRVMGWSEALAGRWKTHPFDHRWDLLPTASLGTTEFLQSLDLFVYDTSGRFSESWGRAVVEAMLCGVVPLIPADRRHHLHRLVPHGHAGFVCEGPEDFSRHARALQDNRSRLAAMSAQARDWAVHHLCRAEDHISRWQEVFSPSVEPPCV